MKDERGECIARKMKSVGNAFLCLILRLFVYE